jgi:hypothetical protein
VRTRSIDETGNMIEDELDEDVPVSSPVVERDVTVIFFHLKTKKEY